jgi:predicted small secreted protein
MMERKRLSVAVGLLLAALTTAGCGDGARPLGPDVEARLNTGEPTEERGPGAVIGSGREGTTTTTSDTTGRGPGGVIGSGS